MSFAFLGVAWGFLKSLPWQLWAFLALVALFWWYGHQRYEAGQSACNSRWEAAQVAATQKAKEAEAKRNKVATAIADDTAKRSDEAVTETRTQTATAVERVRYVTRTIEVPAGCPTATDPRVRDEGRAAVERARAAGG